MPGAVTNILTNIHDTVANFNTARATAALINDALNPVGFYANGIGPLVTNPDLATGFRNELGILFRLVTNNRNIQGGPNPAMNHVGTTVAATEGDVTLADIIAYLSTQVTVQ